LYLEEALPKLPEQNPTQKNWDKNEVTILDYKPERITMSVTSYDTPWLFFSDPFYPGWVARLDGKKVKIYKANYAFRAIAVPPGTHRVVWTYEPILFKIGSGVSLLAWALFCFYYIRRRQHSLESSDSAA
jgi:uncharacterized membrane protein YfhO